MTLSIEIADSLLFAALLFFVHIATRMAWQPTGKGQNLTATVRCVLLSASNRLIEWIRPGQNLPENRRLGVDDPKADE